MDEDPCRPPWEDEAPQASPALAGAGDLLIPLARAQDAVARLEASVPAAPENVAAGLRARQRMKVSRQFGGASWHCGEICVALPNSGPAGI